jgi:hypothetical protein
MEIALIATAALIVGFGIAGSVLGIADMDERMPVLSFFAGAWVAFCLCGGAWALFVIAHFVGKYW